MPAPDSFDYAVIRLVPRVERGECINVGVILFCRRRRFLDARVEVDRVRVHALAPHIDVEEVQDHLDAIVAICRGQEAGGPIARLAPPARFHWLVSPRSTIIQTSPVHSGLTSDPSATLEHTFNSMARSSFPGQ